MKYLRFISDQTPAEGAWGLKKDENTVEICEGHILTVLTPTGKLETLDKVTKYLPPVDAPNVVAIGANYVDHCRESDVEPPKLPLVFIKLTTSVIGHKEPIVLPTEYPDETDYEAEMALVIGKTARNVSQADALDYVLGYTCANDVSARDVQLRIDSQWARGKSFDTFCPLGPWLETELDPNGKRVRFRLNGEEMQDQPTSDMIFSIPRIIEFLSAGATLIPGTVILTGTPCGVGFAQDPPRFLRDGDVATVEVEGVGVLENPVVSS